MDDKYEVDPAKIESCLQRVLSSRWFTSSPNLHKILRYLVDQKLAGKESDLKAYSIAVDALGRPESFDAQNDPSVRMFVGRMRNALADYYSNEGANDLVIFSVPKGRYVPEFIVNENVVDEETIGPNSGGRLRWIIGGSIALLMCLVAIAILGWHLFRHETKPIVGLEAEEGLPVLEVHPLETLVENSELRTVNGIRQQLIVDLAHFKSIRVRALSSQQNVPAAAENGSNPSYHLMGVFQNSGVGPKLNLTLTSNSSNIVVWTKSVSLPRNDAEFQNLLFETSKAIASELVSETGVIKADGLIRLKKRTALLGNTNSSNYECLLLFFAFDKSKSEGDGAAARTCLTRLISANTKDSSIWASWALMQFLDWTKASGPTADELIGKALESARKAVSLDPTNSIAYEYLGSIQSVLGDTPAAMASYEKGIELNPSRPSLRFLIGWQHAVKGDWETGMPQIRRGVELTPSPPGYMRIPLSIDAFRRDDFQTALAEAERIIDSGDQRGIALALVAVIGLKDSRRAEKFAADLRNTKGFDPADPLKELRRSFSNPAILEKYQTTLNSSPLAW